MLHPTAQNRAMWRESSRIGLPGAVRGVFKEILNGMYRNLFDILLCARVGR